MITDIGIPNELAHELFPDNLILLGYRGSIAHGMHVPATDPDSIDDIDLMGIYVGPIQHYLGFGRSDVRERFIDQWDVVSYEIQKFIGLLLNQNPNVIGMLWLDPKHIVYQHPLGEMLRAYRNVFVSRAAYRSFNGYAYGQFKKMTHYNQVAQEEMVKLEEVLTRNGIDLQDPKLTQQQADAEPILKATPESYKALARRYYSGGYMGEKRKRLVRKFHYDTKNAAHLIRLLRMGVEFLKTGEMQVERPDAAELLSIKRGEWSLDAVKAEAERLFGLARDAYEASTLPDEPSRDQAEALLVRIVSQYHGLHV